MKKAKILQHISEEHVFQKENDSNCGPSCLEMVYRRKGIMRTTEDILKDFYFDKAGELTYPPQLARDLLRHDVNTKLLISSPSVISPAWSNLSQKEIIELLKSRVTLLPDDQKHLLALHTLFYLQDGGSFELLSYTANNLKEKLNKGSLLLVGLDEVWIWGHRFKPYEAKIDDIRGSTDGHFVLVTGYQDNTFTVLDPYPTGLVGKHGQYQINQDQLVNASLLWEGIIVEILL